MIYVDEIFTAESRVPQAHFVGERTGHQWCHLWADTREELDAFAAGIGMTAHWWRPSPRWMPSGHYDLTPGKRNAAIAAGAVVTNLRAWCSDKLDFSARPASLKAQ